MTKVVLWKNSNGQLEGVTEADKRKFNHWRRKVRGLEPGEGETVVFQFEDPRSPKHHRLFFLKITELFRRTEAFGSEEDLRKWLIQAAGFVEWEPGPDSTPNAMPISLKFEDLEEAEFAEVHRAIDFVLWSSEGQAKLWPALDEEGRYRAMQQFMEAFE